MIAALASLRFVVLVVSVMATANAIITGAAQMPADCKFWLATVLVALGVYFAIGQWMLHIYREARRSRAEREDWFASFDRRRRMQGRS